MILTAVSSVLSLLGGHEILGGFVGRIFTKWVGHRWDYKNNEQKYKFQAIESDKEQERFKLTLENAEKMEIIASQEREESERVASVIEMAEIGVEVDKLGKASVKDARATYRTLAMADKDGLVHSLVVLSPIILAIGFMIFACIIIYTSLHTVSTPSIERQVDEVTSILRYILGIFFGDVVKSTTQQRTEKR